MPRYPGSGRHHGRGGGRNFVRKNEMIRVREVRVIGPDGKQIGVMQTRDALDLAKKAGLDLVEISASARPPVCRILDFGKYKYELSKKTKDKQHSSSKIKEIKLRVRIEQHDYMTKLKRAEAFLMKGNKVKITLMFRGRENEHKELGFEVVQKAIKDMNHVAVSEADPRLNGRFVNAVIAPLPANKRKRKFTAEDEEPPHDDHDEDDDHEEADHDEDDHHDEADLEEGADESASEEPSPERQQA